MLVIFLLILLHLPIIFFQLYSQFKNICTPKKRKVRAQTNPESQNEPAEAQEDNEEELNIPTNGSTSASYRESKCACSYNCLKLFCHKPQS